MFDAGQQEGAAHGSHSGDQTDGGSTVSAPCHCHWQGERAGGTSPAVKCFQLGMTRTSSAHISLVKASQLVTSNFQGQESAVFLHAG